MKKKLLTIDLKSSFDDGLSDAEYRFLSRFCLIFGTEHCKNTEKPWLALKLPRSTFYRVAARLLETEYLQANPEDNSYSLSVSYLRRISIDNPKSETELSQKWDCREEKESEKKRTKRKDKEKEEYIYNNININTESLSSKGSEQDISKSIDTIVEPEDEKKVRRTREYQEIVGYLNEKTGKRYSPKSKDTQKHISARLDEEFTVEDFKIVIDKKVREWSGTDMEKFLRPETLFSKKFDRYLNETNIIRKTESGWDYRVDAPEDPIFDEIWSAGSGGRGTANG